MNFWDRLRGKGSLRRRARELEQHDPLAAAAMYLRADAPEEASRIQRMLGDAARDARDKLLHYARSIELAPEGTEARREARRVRARYQVALHREGSLTAAHRLELREAADELMQIDEPRLAAEAFRLLGDQEGEARALEAGGEVEALEELLDAQQRRRLDERARLDGVRELLLLVESGQRREAHQRLDALLRAHPADARYTELFGELQTRRLHTASVALTWQGAPIRVVFGEEVVLGRSDADLVVAHAALSRRHLAFRRHADGSAWLRDLGSRNGTQRSGLALAGDLPLDAEVELTLGREISLHITPSTRFEGALELEVGSQHFILPLAPRLSLGARWQLRLTDWLELHGSAPIYSGELALALPTTLLAGDRLAEERGGPPSLIF